MYLGNLFDRALLNFPIHREFVLKGLHELDLLLSGSLWDFHDSLSGLSYGKQGGQHHLPAGVALHHDCYFLA